MNPLLRVTDLNRRFGSQLALSDVSLCLNKCEVLGLLGPNGAGKTTCLRLISGVLAPSEGTIEIEGIDLARHPLEAKRRLGYLPERPPLYPELTVDEYLTFCAKLRRIPTPGIAEAMDEAKRRCGLEASGPRLIAKLSKGYRQRLGIAQAILHRPQLLILDEPTEGLDPVQMRELRRLIRELAQNCGVIFSSHLLPEVQAVCDQVAILHQGRIHYAAAMTKDPLPQVWRVQLSQWSNAEQLIELPNVLGATAIDESHYRVTLDSEGTAAELAREIVQAGMELHELAPERSDLERIFFDLMGAEEQT